MRAGVDRVLGGYSTLPERSFGRLTNDTFSYRGVTYTVTNIAQNRSRDEAGAWRVLIAFAPALGDGAERLTLRLGDVWLNLADARGGGRQIFSWTGAEPGWRSGATVSVSLREFPPAFEPRSIDGWGNNRGDPELGTAHARLLRVADVSVAYGLTGVPPSGLPEPRAISNILAAQAGPVPSAAGLTNMVWQWGQFLDHDLSLTPEASPPEPLPIAIPREDPLFDRLGGVLTMPFNRSAFDPATGTGPDNPRAQINAVTAFIDASNVYGSDQARTRALRTNDGTGRLRASSAGRLLPYNEDRLPNDPGNTRRTTSLYLAGDIRVNEQVGLTALHTVFLREHNRLAGMIASANPELGGQQIFELARKIVGALIQAITYNEFLPLLLGPDALAPYGGYDPGVDPGIATEFSTAAFRFGHTMLSPTLLHIDGAGHRRDFSLAEVFFNPALVEEHGVSGFLRGLAAAPAQEIDLLLVDEVRSMLFGAPGGPLRDLAALNIQRNRDHGLPDYNSARSAYGLPPAQTLADVSSAPGVQDALQRAYRSIDGLDLWAGGLAEDHVPGAMLGETFRTILVDQFRRLRDGDRYWYERDPYFLANPGLLAELQTTTLAALIRRNTPIEDELPDRVFGGPPPAVAAGDEASAGGAAQPATQELPGPQIVALFGYPGAPELGVLGTATPAAIAAQASAWARVHDEHNGERGVVPAYHLVAGVAQAEPTPDGTWLGRLADDEIARYVEAAREHGLLLFLDVQIGWSDPLAEARLLEPFLREPFVHLALDPEFATRRLGVRPGLAAGSITAEQVNAVQRYLAALVRDGGLPPKILIVHQSGEGMIERRSEIDDLANVVLSISMDGPGAVEDKLAGYERFALPEPSERPALKLLFESDTPVMGPPDVQRLDRPPGIIIYQ